MAQQPQAKRQSSEIDRPRRLRSRGLWFERMMALLALSNLMLVLFDMSYIPWRNFYLTYFPEFTQWYGFHIKGIEPHRSTTTYLEAVQQLENQVALTGVQSPEVQQQLLSLQTLSLEMVDENPFEGAGKSGMLERIKNRMRDQVGVESSKDAFRQFWSQDYLSRQGWNQSIDFFNREIQPLIATNYYRGIGENGEPIDRFWKIDLGFTVLFAAEFLARTLYLSRRYQYTSWLDTVIWRCYDLLLILPFWRWLRVIPVVIRLDQAKLVNLHTLNYRVIRTLISSVAVELTEMVVIRILDQTQELIRQGELSRWLLQTHRYVDLNGVNEVEAISKHLIEVIVNHVLPQLRPELEALLHHNVLQVLNSSPVYAGLQRLPGVTQISQQLTQQIVTEVSQNAYQAMRSALQDETGAALMSQLISRFGELFGSEIKQNRALDEIQSLSVDLLEEVKVNYVERLQTEDYEKLRAEKQRIYQISQHTR